MSLPAGASPEGIAIDTATGTIYVANNNGGDGPASLSVILGASCDATNTSGCSHTPPAIPGVGRAPNGIALDQTTRTVYTANAQDSTVSVIDVATPITRRPGTPPRVAVGSLPEAIAIDQANHTVYMTNTFDGTISMLPDQPIPALGALGWASPEAAPTPASILRPGQLDRLCHSQASCT